MPVAELLPLAKQAAPYVDKAWRWLGTNAPGAQEGLLRAGIAKGTQWFGNKLLGGAPETEEYQRRLQEQMRLIQDQIRRPGATPVGQAIQRTIKQQSKQAQQSLAASAARRGQTGTSPSRASQMQELERQAQQAASAMAQLSTSGQQQYNQLLDAQGRLAEEERSALSEIMGFIMKGAAEAGTKKLLSETLQDAWEAPPSINTLPQPQESGVVPPRVSLEDVPQPGALPAPTIGQPQTQIPQRVPFEGIGQPGSLTAPAGSPTQAAEELRSMTPQVTPTPIATPEAVRQQGVTYPSELIQRAPMTRQQPGYQPPVYENIPQQEEYARQVIEQLNQPQGVIPEQLRTPAGKTSRDYLNEIADNPNFTMVIDNLMGSERNYDTILTDLYRFLSNPLAPGRYVDEARKYIGIILGL